MNSPWSTEVAAIFRKELMTEMRSKTGLITGGLFGVATSVSIAFALFNTNPNTRDLQHVCSSLLGTTLLFTSLLSLPRAFLAEEEHGTGDLLRLMCRPHAVFWGKGLFNLALTWVIGLGVSGLFLALTGLNVKIPWMFIGTLLGTGGAMASAVTLCGAIAGQATNRSALAGSIALPLLLPVLQWSVAGLRASFGAGLESGGIVAVVGLLGYATLAMAVGPYIYAQIWKN